MPYARLQPVWFSKEAGFVSQLVSLLSAANLRDGISRLVDVKRNEFGALGWAWLYYFSLLSSYYIIRPIRDEMGILAGVENLQWLFLATFLAMLPIVPLFGWLVSRSPRSRFLPYAYLFFIANLLIFFGLFSAGGITISVARVFYVWVSVFNLFVVSVFWSFMADIFDDAQAKRLFGFIAAGGTLGALCGPAVTGLLVRSLSITNLLVVSASLLMVSVFSIRRLTRWELRSHARPRSERPPEDDDPMLKGGVLDGFRLVYQSPYLLGICLLLVFYSTLTTFLYFQQAEILRDTFTDSETRTAVLAGIDFGSNLLALILQAFFTGRIVQKFGIAAGLAIVPTLLVLCFFALGLAPTLFAVIAVQVLRRAGNYSLMRPSREMLYVVLSREQKYKAKNLIDTTVYRGADVIGAWIYSGLGAIGMGIAQIAFVAVPLSAAWAWISFRIGKAHDARHAKLASKADG